MVKPQEKAANNVAARASMCSDHPVVRALHVSNSSAQHCAKRGAVARIDWFDPNRSRTARLAYKYFSRRLRQNYFSFINKMKRERYVWLVCLCLEREVDQFCYCLVSILPTLCLNWGKKSTQLSTKKMLDTPCYIAKTPEESHTFCDVNFSNRESNIKTILPAFEHATVEFSVQNCSRMIS